MALTNDMALVLEGGGLRGVFTAGILDLFIERGVEFPYVVGVSAGSTNAMSYLSKQKGRTLYADTVLMQERPYIGLKTYLKRGEMIDMEFLFGEFPRSIYPFDWDAFAANRARFEVVATDAHTGEACYFDKADSFERLALIGKASSSLPFLNRPVVVDGVTMVDGGLADSVPLQRARSCGYKRALVILTQCKGYRKSYSKITLPKWLYPRYPKVVEMLNSRAERYNCQLEWVEELERRGEIEVIRPTPPLEVGRLTTDTEKIITLHKRGYEAAEEWLDRYINR